jgi:hypothetical protein
MGALAERSGRDAPRAAAPESLARHFRHWLRDRLVVWLGKLLTRSKKLYDGPSPDEADEDDDGRGRRDSRRSASATGAETAAAASGVPPPPAKRRWGWILSGLAAMFALGCATAGSLVVWYYGEAFASADKLAADSVKEAKLAERKASDSQRAVNSCKDDVAMYKSMHQSDMTRISQLDAALRNRGMSAPPPLPASTAAPSGKPGTVVASAAPGAAGADGCTLSGGGIGEKFKSCVEAMNAVKR